ncbi:MAG: lipopolysaccharide heptosyltransferase II [Candidatus Omnitrophica bacterium]|nr:lipopolysaccharide heptosyltransferase II [Candidatus Omnitrophota bacterium]
MKTNEEKRILIVNVNWLGDVLFSTPLIRAVRRFYPHAYIASMVVPSCREALEGNPNLDEIIVYDEDGEQKSLTGKLNFVAFLRSRQFNYSFILHRSLTRTLIVALSKIPERIGYSTNKQSFLLTKKLKREKDAVHRIDAFLALAEIAGIPSQGRHMDFYITDSDREYARNFLKMHEITKDDFKIVLNAGGNWDPKRWPKESFAALGDELMSRYRARVILTGAPKDVPLAQEIKNMMMYEPAIACGTTTIKQLGAIIESCDLTISNDSGPLHVASALNKSIIAIFGPTSPDITGPVPSADVEVLKKDIECERPCYVADCGDNRCMKAVSVGDVLKAVERYRERCGARK